MTSWWNDKRVSTSIQEYTDRPEKMLNDVRELLEAARKWQAKESVRPMQDVNARDRYVALAGLILWAADQDDPGWDDLPAEQQIKRILESDQLESRMAVELTAVFNNRREPDENRNGSVWTMSLNRAGQTTRHRLARTARVLIRRRRPLPRFRPFALENRKLRRWR
jgi:hypothetical protein